MIGRKDYESNILLFNVDGKGNFSIAPNFPSGSGDTEALTLGDCDGDGVATALAHLCPPVTRFENVFSRHAAQEIST